MPTPLIYNLAKENQWDGNAINFDAAGASIKMSVRKATYSPNIDTDEAYSGLGANEVSGTGYTAGGVALVNQLVSVDTTNDKAEFDFDDVTFSQNAAGFTDGRYGVLYQVAGNVFSYIDFGGDKSVVPGDLVVSPHATDGWMRW